jgi:hypothetical protein
VKEWSEERTTQWLASNGVDSSIVAKLSPCTGEIIHQVREMKSRAPEFFYQAIGAIATDNNVREVAHFSALMDKLSAEQAENVQRSNQVD